MNPGGLSSRTARPSEIDEVTIPLAPPSPPSPAARPVSLRRIYTLTLANFGIAAVWALEMGITTPYFASALASGPLLSHSVWILGPLSGLVMQPLVGHLSDRCTARLGRRRPFIVAGAAGTVVGLLAFCSAQTLARTLFAPASARAGALALAVAAFALMDFSLNAAMLPGTQSPTSERSFVAGGFAS